MAHGHGAIIRMRHGDGIVIGDGTPTLVGTLIGDMQDVGILTTHSGDILTGDTITTIITGCRIIHLGDMCTTVTLITKRANVVAEKVCEWVHKLIAGRLSWEVVRQVIV